jgi:hypothetical protein
MKIKTNILALKAGSRIVFSFNDDRPKQIRISRSNLSTAKKGAVLITGQTGQLLHLPINNSYPT